MAYNEKSLSLMANTGNQAANSIWFYHTEDTTFAAGYFTPALAKGMKANDLIFIIGTADVKMKYIKSDGSVGSVTVTVPVT